MKASEFAWYARTSDAANGAAQALRRGGRDGEIFAVVESDAGGGWTTLVNLHLDPSKHRRFECDSELEALLATELWLDELVGDAET